MNLYQVFPSSYEYCFFVFSPSRNRAKYLCVNYFSQDDTDYIDLRCITLAKGIDYKECVIDYPDNNDEDYTKVKELGYGYTDEDKDE